MNQDEFIQQHTDDGALSPEHAAQLLDAALTGDTASTPDRGSAPTTPAGGGDGDIGELLSAAADSSNVPDGGAQAAEAVILAKDGRHTIPYERLAEAREEARLSRAQAEAAMAQLMALQANAEARMAAGVVPTRADNQVAVAQAAIDAGVSPEVFGDFSERALAAGIQHLVDARVASLTANLQQRVDSALAPLAMREADDALAEHYDEIYARHPDADSIAESRELAEWVAAQPSFARAACEYVMQAGNTAEVIELFDRFKTDTGRTPAGRPGDMQAAAKAALARAATPVPASLSDIPGGRAAGAADDVAIASLSGPDLLDAIQSKGWSPQQIEAFLNRRI